MKNLICPLCEKSTPKKDLQLGKLLNANQSIIWLHKKNRPLDRIIKHLGMGHIFWAEGENEKQIRAKKKAEFEKALRDKKFYIIKCPNPKCKKEFLEPQETFSD